MIPRTRFVPAPKESAEIPESCPPVVHTAVDYEFWLPSGVESFSIIDGVGEVVEESDRYLLLTSTSRTIVMKAALWLVRVQERSWETAPPLFDPRRVDVS